MKPMIADLNYDGIPDMVVPASGNVSVLLGNGDGTFRAEQTLQVATGTEYLTAAALADMDQDGQPDLIVLYHTQGDLGTIRIFKGFADGTFNSNPILVTAQTDDPNRINLAIADFDGDGKLDIACATAGSIHSNPRTLSLYWNQGSLSFNSQYVSVGAGASYLYGLVAGDVNGDGYADLLVDTDAGVRQLLSNGNGTFQAATTVLADIPQSMDTRFSNRYQTPTVLADVNGDGRLDIIHTQLHSAPLYILLGNGNGTYQAPISYSVQRDDASSMVVTDINGDGKPDVLLSLISNSVLTFLGNGNGTFQAGATLTVPAAYSYLATADLNGDQSSDLIVSNSEGANLLVYFNQDAPNLSFQQSWSQSNVAVGPVAVGDINRDGLPDLVAQVQPYIVVYPGNGDGTFGNAQVVTTYTGQCRIKLGDFNGDGRLDIAIAPYRASTPSTSTGVIIFLNNGDGTYTNPAGGNNPDVVFPNTMFNRLELADLNHDGRTDLVATTSSPSSDPSYPLVPTTVTVSLANTDGTFQTTTLLSNDANDSSALVGDFNGDGKPDVLLAGLQSSIRGGNGDGTFQAPISVNLGSFFTENALKLNFDSIAVADFNNDQRSDIVLRRLDSVNNSIQPELDVYLSNGNGTFQSPVVTLVGSAGSADISGAEFQVSDINGDGLPDLAVDIQRKSIAADTFISYLSKGNGTFTADNGPSAGTFSDYLPVSIPDVNHDGRSDVVVASSVGQLGVLLATGSTATRFLVSAPATMIAGSVYPVTVMAANLGSLADPFYSKTVTLSSSDNQFTPFTYTFMASEEGIHTFLVRLTTAGLRSIAVTDGTISGSTQTTVTPTVPSKLFFAQQPVTAIAGQVFNPAIVVQVQDQFGNVTAGDTSAVTLQLLNANGASLGGTLVVNAVNGVATFRDLSITKAGGGYQLMATDGQLTSATSNSFSVNAASADHLSVSAASSTTVGAGLPVTVTAYDAFGNIATGYVGTVTFSSSDGAATLPTDTPFASSDLGVHTFHVALNTASMTGQTIVIHDTQTSSISGMISVPVNQAATSVQIASPSNPSYVGQLAIITATVSVISPGSGTPTGQVVFQNGSDTLGTVNLNGVVGNDQAVLYLDQLPANTYTITATYLGDSNFQASSPSNQISQVIQTRPSSRHWTGKGSNSLWSNPLNWAEQIAPDAGNDLFFGDVASNLLPSQNDFAGGTLFHSLQFTGTHGGYDLTGNAINLSGSIIGDPNAADAIDLAMISLTADATFDAQTSNLSISSAIDLNSFTLILTETTSSSTSTLSGTVSGTGQITKNGPGTWQLTPAASAGNTYPGMTTVNNGVLYINNANSLGTTDQGTVVNSGGSLQIAGNLTLQEALTINGQGNAISTGAVNIQDLNGIDRLGDITLGSASTITEANLSLNILYLTGTIQTNGFDLKLFAIDQTVLTGSVQGAGNVINDGFTSVLSGTGTIAGALQIQQGILSPGVNGQPGALTAGSVQFQTGTTFRVTLGNQVASELFANAVDLNGAILELKDLPSFALNGQGYTLIKINGSLNGSKLNNGQATGQFANLPEGALKADDLGHLFIIHYTSTRRIALPVPVVSQLSYTVNSTGPYTAGQPLSIDVQVGPNPSFIPPTNTTRRTGPRDSSNLGSISLFEGNTTLDQESVFILDSTSGPRATVQTSALSVGTHILTLVYNAVPNYYTASSTTLSVTITPPPPPPPPTLTAGVLVTGSDAGPSGVGKVKVSLPGSSTQVMFTPYANFTGGVRVAVADLFNNGQKEIITAPGAGHTPDIKVFSLSGTSLGKISVLDPSFTGGVYLAVGDVNGDGQEDVIVSMDAGSTARVEVYDGSTFLTTKNVLANFLAYGMTGYTGGVRIAAGDINGDGKADIITAPGPFIGMGPLVKIFSGASIISTPLGQKPALLTSLNVFASSFTGGVYIASGDVTGDRRADVIAGMGSGGSQVNVFDGTQLVQGVTTPLRTITAYDASFTGGVPVAWLADQNSNGAGEIVVAPSQSSNSRYVKIYDGSTSQLWYRYYAYPALSTGVFVGGH